MAPGPCSGWSPSTQSGDHAPQGLLGKTQLSAGLQGTLPTSPTPHLGKRLRCTACPMGAFENYSQLQIWLEAFVNCPGTAPCSSVINTRWGWRAAVVTAPASNSDGAKYFHLEYVSHKWAKPLRSFRDKEALFSVITPRNRENIKHHKEKEKF